MISNANATRSESDEMSGRVCGLNSVSSALFLPCCNRKALADYMYARFWKWTFPERHAAHSKTWYQKNKDYRRRYEKRRYQQPHRKLQNLLSVRSRQAKMKNTPEITKIYARCAELKQWFDVVVDHIIPLSKGGGHEPTNLQIIYRSENLIKGSKLDYKPSIIFT